MNDAANHTVESVSGSPSTSDTPAPGGAPPSRFAIPDEAGRRSTTGSRLYPRVTSFRSRRGAISPNRQDAWDRMWPEIGRNVADEPLDAGNWFGRDAPLVIEIGCGTGTATAAMAQDEPEINLVGIEVYQPGIAQLVQRVERERIGNIRLLRGDAVDVLENMVAPGSLTGVRVFFPDPWPKARHHKRRLLQPDTVALIANRLRTGGVLHVATDHADYAEHILEVGTAEPLLTGLNTATGGTGDGTDIAGPIGFRRPVTKFEDKGRRAGSDIAELIWGKIEE